MPSIAWLRRFGAAFMFITLLAGTPAKAEIAKFMNQCDGKMCAFFRASITIPDGWVEDKEATKYFNSQFLLPKGLDFEKPRQGRQDQQARRFAARRRQTGVPAPPVRRAQPRRTRLRVSVRHHRRRQ